MFAYISVSVLMLAISAQESSVAFFATGTEKQRQCICYIICEIFLGQEQIQNLLPKNKCIGYQQHILCLH